MNAETAVILYISQPLISLFSCMYIINRRSVPIPVSRFFLFFTFPWYHLISFT